VLGICAAFLASSVVAALAAPDARVPGADAIFARAKNAWRARVEAPYVSFNLRERYSWRSRLHDEWWQAAYRDRDRALVLRRVTVAAAEDERLKGAAISLRMRLHSGDLKADSFDTNAAADAFPVLDPLIEPNASFGLLRQEPKAELALVNALSDSPAARPVASPQPQAPQAAPSPQASQSALRELARVEAVARDYAIALAGEEQIQSVDAYHLTLRPLRDPLVYRLRDLWVDANSYRTLQLGVQGLFEGKPYDEARWVVTYVDFNGRSYVQQIHTDEILRFGMDRFVSGLQFDFVQYDFPPSLPDLTFTHYI